MYTTQVIGWFLPVISTAGCAVTGNGNLTTATIGFQDIGIVKPSYSNFIAGVVIRYAAWAPALFFAVLPLFYGLRDFF